MENESALGTIKELDSYKLNDWLPEDFGFRRVKGEGRKKGSVWIKKDKFSDNELIVVCISNDGNLFVLKKIIKVKDKNGNYKVNYLLKWHMVIDNNAYAEIYLTTGLRG